jgi:hypothetical protein
MSEGSVTNKPFLSVIREIIDLYSPLPKRDLRHLERRCMKIIIVNQCRCFIPELPTWPDPSKKYRTKPPGQAKVVGLVFIIAKLC